MPPEPLPWERKDFVFKDRKHERIASGDGIGSSGAFGGGGISTPRWRDPYHFPRASPRRPPPSYHRQNGSYYQPYEESNGHGCTPSRSDDVFRLSNGRYSGGRSNSIRDSRGSIRRSSPYYDGTYLPAHATSQRSVAVPITSPPSPPSKDVLDKNSGGADDQRPDRDRDRERDRGRDRDRNSLGSIGWKMWGRQGSISLSSKTTRSEAEEAGNGSLEVLVTNLGRDTPVRSPVCSPAPAAPVDDGALRKKPRLTWGQGLAKYEKQKVEGSANSGKDQTSESSPMITALAGSMSPATPCSIASASPAFEDHPFSKMANFELDTRQHIETCALEVQKISKLPVKLREPPSLSMLTSLLNDLLQPDDAFTGDSTSPRNTTINKLLLFKADISKELEKTECEIDSLEGELKSLNCDEQIVPSQISSELPADGSSGLCLESEDISSKASSNLSPRVPSAVVEERAMLICSSSCHGVEVSDVNADIPPAASLNAGQSICSGNEQLLSFELDTKDMERCQLDDSNELEAGNNTANANLGPSSQMKVDDDFISLIMACNKVTARMASQVFERALPTAFQSFDVWGSDKMLLSRKNDMHIRKMLALQKHQLKFKEQVLTLKFRALHYLWKEDLRVLSARKQRPKSQKRFELCNRATQSSSQKYRSTTRSRLASSADNMTLLRTTDIVDFTSRLLSDSQIKLYRKNLKMPALILDEKERKYSRFVSKNNLIEDPTSFERERSMINPWRQEEKGLFMEMLATFGKDFGKISSFLSHKTTADCIEFYYKNHKSESFRDVKKQLNLRKQWQQLSTNTYLVTSGKKWNREANAASLDMLGVISAAVAQNTGNAKNQTKYSGRSAIPNYHNPKASRGSYSSLERASSVEISGYEKETVGTDLLAEAVSSCITSSPPEKLNHVRLTRPLTPEVTNTIEEEDTCSDEGCGELDSVDWTDEEKALFIRSLGMYGKDFARISDCVGTKSRDQCKIFYSKARKCLSLDQIHPGTCSGGTPLSDADGGRSYTDDACAAEMDSAICSTQSCSRIDMDFTRSPVNNGDEGFTHIGSTSLQTETDRSSEQYEPGGCMQEEVDGKVDALESVLKDEKMETKLENIRSVLVEGTSGAASEHNKHVASNDVQELVVDNKIGKLDSNVSASSVELGTISCTGVGELEPRVTAVVSQGVVVGDEFSEVGAKSKFEFQKVPLLPEPNSAESKQNVGTDGSSSVKFSLPLKSTAKETDDCTAPEVSACSNHTANFSVHEQPVPLELFSFSQKKHHSLTVMQDSVHSLPPSMMLPVSSAICSEGSLHVPSQSSHNYNENLHKLHQGSSAKEYYQQRLSGINLNQMDQSSHVLSGYPVQVVSQKELMKETDMISVDPVLDDSCLIGNSCCQLNRYFGSNMPNGKAEESLATKIPGMFFQRKEMASESQLRPCSLNACRLPEKQPNQRTGDVKLFGQILSNPSSQKQISSILETENQFSAQQTIPTSTKIPNSKRGSTSAMIPSRSESISHSNLEEVPLQSYGFWDGNRIQTGLTSLPESAVMVAAYQGSVPGTQLLPAKDSGISANGASTSYQQAYVQPLSVNGKRLDSFPELQKRNGFELVSGFQQGGRTAMARLALNVPGGNHGILLGKNGVSDPVAALKMAKLYTGEVESWTRDLNRR